MHIKKWMKAVGVALMAVCFLCACQSSNVSEETVADETLPKLKIGVDDLNPFFFTDENGNQTGIDAEIAIEACRRAGYTPDFLEIDWNSKDSYLQNGSVDCLWTAFTKNGREDLYHWTDTYLQSNLRAIVDAKSPDKDIQSTMEHGSIAVRAGSKAEEVFLQNADGQVPVQVYSCGTFEMAETAFVKGYAGALCCQEAVLERVMSNYPGLYRFLDGVIMQSDFGVAFSKNDTSDKYGKINAALNEMKADGTISDIYARYHSETANAEEVPEYEQK